VKWKLAELDKLVDTIQQSSAHIHGMETVSEPHAVDHDSKSKTKQLPNAATVRRSEADAEHAMTSQRETEREQRWEWLVMCVSFISDAMQIVAFDDSTVNIVSSITIIIYIFICIVAAMKRTRAYSQHVHIHQWYHQ